MRKIDTLNSSAEFPAEQHRPAKTRKKNTVRKRRVSLQSEVVKILAFTALAVAAIVATVAIVAIVHNREFSSRVNKTDFQMQVGGAPQQP